MENLFVLALVGLTSLGVILIGTCTCGLSWNDLRRAIGKMLEGVGLSLIFFAVNLTTGMAIVLVGRLLTRGFVSLYLADDATLLVLSVLQGLIFQWWRERQASTRGRRLGAGGSGHGTDSRVELREGRSA